MPFSITVSGYHKMGFYTRRPRNASVHGDEPRGVSLRRESVLTYGTAVYQTVYQRRVIPVCPSSTDSSIDPHRLEIRRDEESRRGLPDGVREQLSSQEYITGMIPGMITGRPTLGLAVVVRCGRTSSRPLDSLPSVLTCGLGVLYGPTSLQIKASPE